MITDLDRLREICTLAEAEYAAIVASNGLFGYEYVSMMYDQYIVACTVYTKALTRG
jgi:hypothetical protein